MGKPYKIKRHKRIYRRSAGSILLRIVVILAAAALLFGIGWALYGPVIDWISSRQQDNSDKIGSDVVIGASDETQTAYETKPEQKPAQTPEASTETQPEALPQEKENPSMTAYISVETAADPQKFGEALDSLKSEGFDSVMFDLKSISGTVNYPISYEPYSDSIVTGSAGIDLASAVSRIKEAGLIPVASIYTFRDNLYPLANNNASTLYKNSDFLWVDNDPEKGGKPWINPFTSAGQDYIRKIVDDACEAGFEMIVFQGMQFPQGYSLEMIDYGSHAGEDKNAFLKGYLAQMTEYAAAKGAELTCIFPASSMLGGNSAMYFGDTSNIAGSTAAVDIRPSVFGSGLNTELVSIPNPTADVYNTVKTAGAAVSSRLSGKEVIAVLDGKGLDKDALSALVQGAGESGIARYIVEK